MMWDDPPLAPPRPSHARHPILCARAVDGKRIGAIPNEHQRERKSPRWERMAMILGTMKRSMKKM